VSELLVINEDATWSWIPNEYEAIKLAIGNWIDICRGYGPVAAFVDDEGLLRGRQFNVVGSICLGRPVFGPAVLTANEMTEEGDTLPPPVGAAQAFSELANIWQAVLTEATRLGQSLTIVANADTVPGPEMISMTEDEFTAWLATGSLPRDEE
jgi:hypothetical protein